MKVMEVMTRDVKTVRPDASLKEAAAVLSELGVSGLPVVDDEGAVLGVISEADILAKERAALPERGRLYAALHPTELIDLELKLEAERVSEAMTWPAVTIESTTPIARAAAIMIDKGFKRLPVVDDGKLVGIVTRADLVRAFTRSDFEIEREIRNEVVQRTLWIAPEAVTVRVKDGTVAISGRVETEGDAKLLPELIRRVPGVVSVGSDLTWPPEAGRRKLSIY